MNAFTVLLLIAVATCALWLPLYRDWKGPADD